MTHDVIAHLIAANEKWAHDVEAHTPGFFKESAKGQAPKVLWIGCADSRVPESVITAAKPGDIFVHRNIANQFHLHDDSVQAVITYAVDHLGVTHVCIVGHTECGGAAACAAAAAKNPGVPASDIVPVPSHPANAPINKFLGPLTALAVSLKLPEDPKKSVPLLVDANVKAQVENVTKSETIVGAWKQKKDVYVHGLRYNLAEGKLEDLGVSKGPPS